MPDTITLAQKAAERATELLGVLNREHSTDDLYRAVRAVRHEVETVQDLLSAFGQDITNPREGLTRKGAPETSQAAARAIKTRSGSQRHELLRYLHRVPELADFELQRDLWIGANSQRPRRVELLRAGYIEPARDGEGKPLTTKHPTSGLQCQRWRVTERGRVALGVLEAGQMVIGFPGDGE
jgi:hypothetical protein